MVISAAWLGYSSMSTFPITGIWKSIGIIAGVIFFLGAILLHFIDMQKKIYEYENPKPNVIAQNVESELIYTTGLHILGAKPTGQSSGTSNLYILHKETSIIGDDQPLNDII